jgi:acetoin utilization deacetylase AcuC-like enzyme
MPLALIHTDQFTHHDPPPGHPESPARGEVMEVVAREWRERGGEVIAPREATREQLARVHDAEHLRRIEETAGHATSLDLDTYTSPESYELALRAAGACVDAVEHVLAGRHDRALAMVRPPGHHAERNRAMGFCLYNNVAVAAAHARALGASRVAIVDFDVHHGNGTQHIFEADPTVLYVSTHQYPFYPGTGAAGEIGSGAARGYTVNVPLEVGAVDEDYRLVFAEVVLPILRQFKPDLVVVSAGFDAHERDPLAGMRLTTDAFAAMTNDLRLLADECCGGRLVVATEGGYDLKALAACLRGMLNVLSPDVTGRVAWSAAGAIAPSRGRAAITQTVRALAGHWQFPA